MEKRYGRLWVVASGDRSDRERPRIPALEVKNGEGRTRRVETSVGKSKAFFKAYFPLHTTPPANVPRTYPKAKWEYQPTSDEQIYHIIKSLKPFKSREPMQHPTQYSYITGNY